MAPTTLPNQVTSTSPAGRDVEQAGYPIRMAELLATLQTPSYIARVSVHDPQHIVQTKKAIKKAFKYQADNVCFSLVEVVSNCPTNWGQTPKESIDWLEKNMLEYFELGEFKTPDGGNGKDK